MGEGGGVRNGSGGAEGREQASWSGRAEPLLIALLIIDVLMTLDDMTNPAG